MYKEIINNKIAENLKNKDTVKLAVWRAIKTEFINFEKSGNGCVLDDASELKIIGKMVAQRKDAYQQYKEAGRNDLSEKENKEAEILSDLLPKEPTDDEIIVAVNDAKNALKLQYGEDFVPSMKNMKEVQSIVRLKYPTADGGKIAKIYKENIN